MGIFATTAALFDFPARATTHPTVTVTAQLHFDNSSHRQLYRSPRNVPAVTRRLVTPAQDKQARISFYSLPSTTTTTTLVLGIAICGSNPTASVSSAYLGQITLKSYVYSPFLHLASILLPYFLSLSVLNPNGSQSNSTPAIKLNIIAQEIKRERNTIPAT